MNEPPSHHALTPLELSVSIINAPTTNENGNPVAVGIFYSHLSWCTGMHKHLSEMGLIKSPSQKKHEMMDNAASHDVIIQQRCGLQKCAIILPLVLSFLYPMMIVLRKKKNEIIL